MEKEFDEPSSQEWLYGLWAGDDYFHTGDDRIIPTPGYHSEEFIKGWKDAVYNRCDR